MLEELVVVTLFDVVTDDELSYDDLEIIVAGGCFNGFSTYLRSVILIRLYKHIVLN